jgi:hypothetical protein
LSLHADVFRAYQNDLKGALDLISTGSVPRATELNQLECAAWTAVANALLNLDETLTKE